MTTLEVIQAAATYLAKHDIESPRLNAEHLLAHSLGKKRLDLYLEFDRPLSEADRAPLRDLVRRRGEGHPLQHLVGTTEFYGREFLTDPRALIPRPETEQLVELFLSTTNAPLSTVLDCGTGTGVIAITLALELPTATVHATDLSAEALALARENATRLTATNVTFHQADLLPDDDTRYDAIVANLPYISAAAIANLSREVQHDPTAALDGGPDGLDLIRTLIKKAPEQLNPGAPLLLEIGHDQSQEVLHLCQAAGLKTATAHQDYHGINRFIRAAT